MESLRSDELWGDVKRCGVMRVVRVVGVVGAVGVGVVGGVVGGGGGDDNCIVVSCGVV